MPHGDTVSSPLQRPVRPWPGQRKQGRPGSLRGRGLEAGLSGCTVCLGVRARVCVVSGTGLADRKGRLCLGRKGLGFGQESKP